MFDDQTVLVLGAGTSRPYGFPTSGELRRLLLGKDVSGIFKNLGFENVPSAASKHSGHMLDSAAKDERRLNGFREAFGEAERISIDSFIAGRSGSRDGEFFEEIARNAVAHIILHCEENAKLHGDWYQWLLEFLVAEGRDFPGNRLSIVTFNYDRSLEMYLWRSFKASFGLDEKGASEMLGRIPMVHVYGSVGPFDIPIDYALRSNQSGWITESGTRFGDLRNVFNSAKQLGLASPRTFEQVKAKARGLIEAATRVIFIGFGFWRENLDILHDQNHNSENYKSWAKKKILASRCGLWESVRLEVSERFRAIATSSNEFVENEVAWGGIDEDALKFVTQHNLKRGTFRMF